MKNKQKLFAILYYPAVLIIVALLFALMFLVLSFVPLSYNYISAAMFIFIVWVYCVIPCCVAVISRFSLLKWRVDPFIAAIYPLFIMLWVFRNTMLQTSDFASAVSKFFEKLFSISSLLSLAPLIIGAYIFVLACSYSIARVKGESAGFKIINKFSKNN